MSIGVGYYVDAALGGELLFGLFGLWSQLGYRLQRASLEATLVPTVSYAERVVEQRSYTRHFLLFTLGGLVAP